MVDAELSPELADFPKRLRTLRKQMRISQHELSQLCGLSLNQISRYELGIREPTAASLVKMARALNVSMDYLAGLTDEQHGLVAAQELNAYERAVIDAFRNEGWSGIARLGVERLSK